MIIKFAWLTYVLTQILQIYVTLSRLELWVAVYTGWAVVYEKLQVPVA